MCQPPQIPSPVANFVTFQNHQTQEDAAAIKPFLYLQILIHMLLDGDGVNTDNDAFIEGFVQAAGLKPDDCIELEVQAEGTQFLCILYVCLGAWSSIVVFNSVSTTCACHTGVSWHSCGLTML